MSSGSKDAAADAVYVISRYAEDISWLIPLFRQCIVYNKGRALDLAFCDVHEHAVPNVGRESETYLRFIIDNYECLPDVTVFSQGAITDHIQHWAWTPICGGRDLTSDPAAFLQELAVQAAAHGISEPSETFDAATKHPSWRRDWNNVCDGALWYGGPERYHNCMPIAFDAWFEQHIGRYPTARFIAHTCGLFAVRRDFIRSRSLEFYQRLHACVKWHHDPVEGHFLERSWHYIFCEPEPGGPR